MRPLWLALICLGGPISAQAQAQPQPQPQVPSLLPPPVQSPSIQGTSLPPLQEQKSFSPRAMAPEAMAPEAKVPGPPPSVSPKISVPAATAGQADTWLPAGTAKIQALDKVNAHATALIVKVGQSAVFGSLTIQVKACVIRPPDQPADAAAYLDVTDSHPDSPGFAGWMLQQEPAASMMQHPMYDLRVTGCT